MIPIWLQPMLKWGEFQKVKDSIRTSKGGISIFGLSESQKCHLTSSIIHPLHGYYLYITYSESLARKIYEDLKFFYPDETVFFPGRDSFYYSAAAHSLDITEQRLKVLERLAVGKNTIVVASIDAVLCYLTPLEIYKESMFTVKVGHEIPLARLSERVAAMGYKRVPMVEGRGQYSIRGAIFDIFPMTVELPYRMEFFDEEVDSIRTFDPLTQRSADKMDEVLISSVRELVWTKEAALRARETMQKELSKQMDRGESQNFAQVQKLKEKVMPVIERLDQGIQGTEDENYFSYFYPQAVSLLEYLDEESIIVVDEPSRIRDHFEGIQYEFAQYFEELLTRGEVLPGQGSAFINYDDFLIRLKQYTHLILQALPKGNPDFRPRAFYHWMSRTIPSYHGKLDMLVDDLAYWKSRNYSIILLSGNRSRGESLVRNLNSLNVEALYRKEWNADILPGQVAVLSGTLNKGFDYPDARLVIISDQEIFGVQKRRTAVKKKTRKLNAFTDLKTGDYVVHENHGIGRYTGIETLIVNGQKKDYLHIKYSGTDTLYIPTDQMDLIQPYIGMDGKTPKLSKLGGTEWQKTKSKARQSIRKLAIDLLKLYAQRENTKGHIFSSDTEWQRQFEDLFPYEETPDQLQAIEEIKRDMESPRAMDRLLCGDVGYGKTEVAIRAAFKAVMDGKQVAVLAPTTVLAQQHYNTFITRFEEFPFTVQVLSRFRKPAEQRSILKALKEGNIDIIIGTHRLLSKDVRYRDLGLLVIDEEQRFGVEHKEIIKNISRNVDVLTLTATPIPRTLHMSMVGIRDVSIIETPPEERYPVQTYVVEYNESLVRDAILREIHRGGQVFFVYNRVRTMDRMAQYLQGMLPDIRIAVAHGQMSENQLEKVMIDFYDQEYDLLLCSTIIESGLDIPNVNTIIVYDAGRLGLSQLYQLRGRVGRSNRQAYAYLTYRKDKILSEVAEKRLMAIKEFTEFGAGFKIAMRDLEIRGAGNLLGAEQHGHMAAVGYDLYCKLLEDTMRSMKGEEKPQTVETMVDIKVNAHISQEYIPAETQKIEVYKKIAAIDSLQDRYDVEEELEDRFGDPPEEVRNLLNIAYLKVLAKELMITEIVHQGREARLKLLHERALSPRELMIILNENRQVLRYNRSQFPMFTLALTDSLPQTALKETISFLEQSIRLKTS